MERSKRELAKRMAIKAYNTIPLYHRLAQKNELDVDELEFEQFPIVDKSYYVESGMSCLSPEYIGDYIGKRLIKTRTSGSTGKFTEVYWKKEEDNASLLSLWLYRKKYYGISARDRLCYFFPSDSGDREFYEGRNVLGVSRKFLYQDNLQDAYQRILEYDPVWMILQPSLAVLLCDMAENVKKTPHSLRYIEFTGEYLDVGVRKRVETIFTCKTANQYGTKEVNSIAYECPCGTLHCMSGNVYMEILDETGNVAEGKEGDICITTLRNGAMPLIRFNIEDRGSIQRNATCACGRKSDVLTLKAGRKNDWVWNKDGTKKHAYVLMQVIHNLNIRTDGTILQYQIIQEDYEKFKVTLVMDEMEYFAEVAEVIAEQFSMRLGVEVETKIEWSEEILPMERTGKLACFISELEEGK